MTPSLIESLPGLVREWLGRSGVLPLTIVFKHDRINYDYESSDDSMSLDSTVDPLEDVTELAIEILNSQSGRWRNLHLNAAADIFGSFSGRPTQLIGLDLAVKSPLHPESLTPVFKMELQPNPTHLYLNDFPLTSINIGWESVTHATLNSVSAKEGADILRRAPNLQCLCVSIDLPTHVGSILPILHPGLHSLELTSTCTEIPLLKALTLPSLKEWTQDVGGARLPTSAILSLFKRSNCCLNVLKLHDLPSPSMDLYNLLRAIPTLEHLRLTFHFGSKNFTVMDRILYQTLCSAPSGGNNSVETATPECLIPRLQSIQCITTAPFSPFTWDRLPQLIRQSHRRSITLISTTSRQHMLDETALQLLQLVDEGVDLQISDQSIGGDFLENFRNGTHKQGVWIARPRTRRTNPKHPRS